MVAIHTYHPLCRDSNQTEQALFLFSCILVRLCWQPVIRDHSVLCYLLTVVWWCTLIRIVYIAERRSLINVGIVPSEKTDRQLLSQVIQTIPWNNHDNIISSLSFYKYILYQNTMCNMLKISQGFVTAVMPDWARITWNNQDHTGSQWDD